MTDDNDMRMRNESRDDNPIKDDTLITVIIGGEVVYCRHTALPIDKDNFAIRKGNPPDFFHSTVDKLQADGKVAGYVEGDTDKAFKLACKFLGAEVDGCPVGFHDNDGFGEYRDCKDICNSMPVKECWEAYFRWKVTG